MGHFRFQKTHERIKHSFFWEGMKKDIHNFVVKCDTFQYHKEETMKRLGALQPLHIPTTMWDKISMDFIMGLLV
jgi:hypothetical protein